MQLDLAVLILAAGSSSRLGSPKQLLEYAGKTLLEHAAADAMKLTPDVYVVLGHARQQCEMALEDVGVTTLLNPYYEDGMGRSIAYAVSQIPRHEHLLIMLCDQPLIPQAHYRKLIDNAKENPTLMIASEYNAKPGVPALFPSKYYQSLQMLEGDKGAKPLLMSNTCILVPIDASYTLDIDTKEDWEHFNKLKTAIEKNR